MLAGAESTDGYTGTMPERVAELLGCPARRSRARSRSPTASVKVQRQTEAGYDEVECPLPAVVTVTAGVVEPRYPSFKGIMAAKTKPVEQLTLADLGLTAADVAPAQRVTVGLGGAPRRRPARYRGRRRRRGQDRRVPREAKVI